MQLILVFKQWITESIYLWKFISYKKKAIKGNLFKKLISILNQKRFHTRETIKDSTTG